MNSQLLPNACTFTPTESLMLSVASSTLGRALAPEDAGVPLSVLGADSLTIVELAAAVEAAIDGPLPPEIAHESATLREIAEWIDRGGRDGSGLVAEDDRLAEMLADSILPGDVRPGVPTRQPGLLESRAILITGATGFLGARIAADLLARSKARLYCVVRDGWGNPAGRLRARLLDIGVDATAITARVEIIHADLTLPRLGLPEDEWARLGRTIDRVVHVGASVNWVAPYRSLRAANVLGTIELLRLACRADPIPFHFVSSLSVCYAVDGPPEVDETFDPLPHLRGIHLGYAQTKVVGEALVREAGRRGLPVRIYRPSLISGDSRTGAFNADDLLSLLIRGCVRMGAAPDLDWALDCEPVDVVSAGILQLSGSKEAIAHLSHQRPRHWRECLLWMRLAGHVVQLVPYAEWLERLERDTRDASDHPLGPLRAFFRHRPAGARGLTLPELYEDSRRSRASAARTNVNRGAAVRPALDASLLDRYFAAYQARGYLPAPPAAPDDRPAATPMPRFDAAFFEAALSAAGRPVRVCSATRISAGSAHSITSELTAWRSGQAAGLFRYRLGVASQRGARSLAVVVKVTPHANDVIAVGEAIARLCGERLGDAYTRWRGAIGLTGSHLRERAIYESAGLGLAGYRPALLGAVDLGASGRSALVLEDVSDARLMDSVDRTPVWHRDDIEVAVTGLAGLHARSYGGTARLEAWPWIDTPRTTASMTAMADLWSALADHAAPAFARWGGGDLPVRHQRAIASIERWRPILDQGPQTLLHHDFNPRNLCLREAGGRESLCAYDWELAAIGAPQRDLAEFLCFVLPEHASGGTIDHWIDRHRTALARASGVTVAAAEWRRGFHAAMHELLVDRLAMYALIDRIRRQTFLPRVIASWRRIDEHLTAGGSQTC